MSDEPDRVGSRRSGKNAVLLQPGADLGGILRDLEEDDVGLHCRFRVYSGRQAEAHDRQSESGEPKLLRVRGRQGCGVRLAAIAICPTNLP